MPSRDSNFHVLILLKKLFMNISQQICCFFGGLFPFSPLSIFLIQIDFLFFLPRIVVKYFILLHFSDRTIIKLIPIGLIQFLGQVDKAEIVTGVGGSAFVHNHCI
jgi:hypothetical protein